MIRHPDKLWHEGWKLSRNAHIVMQGPLNAANALARHQVINQDSMCNLPVSFLSGKLLTKPAGDLTSNIAGCSSI
jgi:hypothetical protein